MRVLFNGVTLLKPRTGIAHAAANLHAALTAGYPADTFWLYPGTRVAALAPRFFASGAPGASPPRPPGLLKRVIKRSVSVVAKTGYAAHFQTAARLGRFDLYHEPNFVPFRTGLPLVVTVFDLSVLLYPQWHPAQRVKAHEAAFHRGVQLANHVIVGTQAVRAEVVKHLGLTPDRVTPMFCGVGSQFRPQTTEAIAALRARYQLPHRYTLYVGTIEPRKNIGTLLRAYCDLPADVRERCPLVLAGGWGWKAETERELFHSEARHKGVIHLGYVPDADLPALYSGADALLYPTFYEGFGMPPVEAMACGTPAVTSTARAVREVVGDSALVLEPDDVADWRDTLAQIAKDDEFLREYRRRGPARAARFTWAACANIVHDVYRRVLGSSAGRPGSTRAAA